ncbi:MAG: hypothetical protein AMXMBFR64_60110 [Myxococcales bacterium]
MSAQTRRWPLALLLPLVLAGAGVGGLLTWHHERELYGGAESQDGLIGCEESATVSCDLVNTSEHSEILGVPIATLAIPVYLLAAILCLGALRGRAGTLPLLAAMGAGATAYSAFLFYVSAVQLGYVCAWCLRLYGVNAAMLALPLLAGSLRAPRPTRRTIALTAVTFVLLGTVAVAGQRTYRATLLEQRPPELTAVRIAPLPERVESAPAPDPAGPPPVSEVVLAGDEGELRLPISPDDPWRGNRSATVTVVEFADLQCGYCKRAAAQLDRLYAAYADRVLFVFKHFPMDPACNPGVKNRLHGKACVAAKASVCAQQQGRFWDFSHLTFKNQHALDAKILRTYAERVGLDVTSFDACMASDVPTQQIRRHGEEGAAVGVRGTPRIYIGGQLYRSGASAEQMAMAIEVALGATEDQARVLTASLAERDEAMAQEVPADTPPLRTVAIGSMRFRMFTFEGALSEDGRAESGKRRIPATNMSWYAARDACAAAGLRLCSEKEWVAACQGEEPVDDNGNGAYADDIVEGTSYPYGDYHERDRCWDGKEGEGSRPVYTGELPACVSTTGVYDLTGNVEEWVGLTEGEAVLLGGAFDTAKDHARCYRRNDSFGAGLANRRTGFRCCGD